MRNKMITLDPTAYEYASNMKNFSQFVRNCIHAHAQGEDIVSAMRQRAYWKEQSDLKSKTIDGLLDHIRELSQ